MSERAQGRPTLHALRRSHNLTLSELARRTGIPMRRLAEFEYQDGSLRPAEHDALADIFGPAGRTAAGGIGLTTVSQMPRDVVPPQRRRTARWAATATAALSVSLVTPLSVSAQGASTLDTCPSPRSAVLAPEAAQRRWVEGSGLNLRQGPGVNHCVVHVLVQGTEIILQDESRQVGTATWVKVLTEQHEGWVNQHYLLDRLPVVTSPGLNLRAGPGVTNSILHVLTQGSEAVPRGGSSKVGQSTWIKVLSEQHEGWVNRRFLADRSRDAEPAATTADQGELDQLGAAAEAVVEPFTAPQGMPQPEDMSQAGAATTGPAYVCPVVSQQGPIRLTQGYGVGTHVPAEVWGAIDLAPAGGPAAAQGALIVAAHAGTVQVAFDTWPGGNYVSVYGADGVRTGYAHLQSISVENGQVVDAGQVLGVMGSTGSATGPHLDFQVWHNGVNVDPTNLVDCQ